MRGVSDSGKESAAEGVSVAIGRDDGLCEPGVALGCPGPARREGGSFLCSLFSGGTGGTEGAADGAEVCIVPAAVLNGRMQDLVGLGGALEGDGARRGSGTYGSIAGPLSSTVPLSETHYTGIGGREICSYRFEFFDGDAEVCRREQPRG